MQDSPNGSVGGAGGAACNIQALMEQPKRVDMQEVEQVELLVYPTTRGTPTDGGGAGESQHTGPPALPGTTNGYSEYGGGGGGASSAVQVTGPGSSMVEVRSSCNKI